MNSVDTRSSRSMELSDEIDIYNNEENAYITNELSQKSDSHEDSYRANEYFAYMSTKEVSSYVRVHFQTDPLQSTYYIPSCLSADKIGRDICSILKSTYSKPISSNDRKSILYDQIWEVGVRNIATNESGYVDKFEVDTSKHKTTGVACASNDCVRSAHINTLLSGARVLYTMINGDMSGYPKTISNTYLERVLLQLEEMQHPLRSQK
jgi:hypothetical protein